MFQIERQTQKGFFTTAGKWEMVMSQLEYTDNLYPTREAAQEKIRKIAAAYEEPENIYRIVESK